MTQGQMTKKTVAIIGAGIAGLSAAVRLQSNGYEVTVFEANSYPGGKLTAFEAQGYRFDMGPSLFTMPQFVEELFQVANEPIDNYFEYKQKEIVCNYFFEDETRFSAHAQPEAFAKEAAEVFDVDENTILNYFNSSKVKYDLTAGLFLEKSLHKLSTYLSKDTLKAITHIFSLDIHKSLNEVNQDWFSDPKLVQLFNRFATYNGSNPYATPGIMSMIPHLEQHFGTYFPKGGMHQITMSIYKLAQNLGVTFNFNTKIEEIIVKHKQATGISTNGEVQTFDLVVSNADVMPTYRHLLQKQKAPEKILKQPRSSSALIFYWGIRAKFKELDLHNIFFSDNYEREFDCIFNENTIFNDPTVYINITSKEEPNDAPKGCENWFTMINVPSNKGQDWDLLIEEARSHILKKLSRILKKDISSLIEFENILDPRAIESKTQSYQGALYGAASNNKFAAFLRHPNFTNTIENLYFCGGSVHPGGGIPLCLLSGKIVSDLITKSH